MFSSRSFMISSITFNSLIHYELILEYGARECFSFILLHVAVQVSQLSMFFLFSLLFKYILLIMLLQFSHFFLPFIPSPPCNPLPSHILPPEFMSMGCTYTFFGFSISYAILNLPCLFYAYQLCFLFPVSSPLFFPSPSPLKTLHVIFISLVLFLF